MAYHVSEYVMLQSGADRYQSPAESGLNWFLGRGFLGVQLFFVISAFVVALPFARHHLKRATAVRLRHYFTRRVTRLEPPYLIHLVLSLALVTVLPFSHYHGTFPQGLVHLVVSTFYAHAFVYGEPSTLGYYLWSLEIEAQFYVLAPLLALVFAVHGKWLRRSILVAGMLAVGLLQPHLPGEPNPSDARRFSLLHQLHYFLAGFLLLDFYLTEWDAPSLRPAAWDLIATLAFAAVPFTIGHGWLPHVLIPPLLLIAYAGCFRGAAWRWLLRRPLVYTIGGMCYSLYLYHFWIMVAADRVTRRAVFPAPFTVNLLVQLALLLPVMVAGGAVMFLLFEKPFMRRDWPARVWAWWRGRGDGFTTEARRHGGQLDVGSRSDGRGG